MQVKNWSRLFDLCHVKGVAIGANQQQVDLSPSNLVTIIIPLFFMASDVHPHQLDVWTLMSPNSIVP